MALERSTATVDRLRKLVGHERPVAGVSDAIHLSVVERRPPDAHHVGSQNRERNVDGATWMAAGRQYVVIAVRGGDEFSTGDYIVAFALPER